MPFSRHPLVLLAAALVVQTSAAPARACRCVEGLTPKRAYWNAQVVVVGRVVSLETTEARTQAQRATVAVERAWKASVPETVTVYTDSTCAFAFTQGERYLLYLAAAPGKVFGTSRCAGNRDLDAATRDLRWLKSHARETSVSQERPAILR